MITDPIFYLAAIPGVLVVGLSKGGFGGSIALLGLPLIALVIPPLQAAGIMLPILILMDVFAVSAYRRIFDAGVLKTLIPAGVAGIVVGWMTASMVSAAHVRLIVGTVGIVFVLDYMLSGRRSDTPVPQNPVKGSFWGAIAGFTSFVSHAGGPPFQMYTLPLRLEPRRFAGTAVMFFAVMNATKLVPYFALGQFSARNLATSAVLMPIAPIGVFIGIKLVKVLPMKPFYRIIYAAVLAVSARLVWQGVAEIAVN